MPDRPVLADRYELLELLGRGGMADVHRAHDRLLHRQVAVKVLRDSTTDDRARARFAAETRTLARLSHSGLVMVLDAGSTDDRPFLVMELVEGETLADLILRGPVDPRTAAAVGVQLADALAYAHREGVVHRDVKPANVLLGEDDRVRLADFGIARLIGDTVRHTQTGSAVGTAAYLAPEQVTGKDVTGAADVYALGLVLLEALTAERAYPGSLVEAAHARLHRQPEIPGHLSAAWRDLLTVMTDLEPDRRPSADEVVALLRDQPTAHVPVASSTPAGLGAAATATLVAPAPSPVPTDRQHAVTQAETPVSRIDRAGDEIARVAVDRARRAREGVAANRGLTGALVALLVLLLVVGVAATTGGEEPPSDVPTGTPAELRPALQDLHDAVEGR